MMRFFVPLAAAVAIFTPAHAARTDSRLAATQQDQLIVVFESAVVAKRSTESGGWPVRHRLLGGRATIVELPAFTDARLALASFRRLAGVRYAEPLPARYPTQTAPDDPLFDELWGILNTGQDNYVSGGPAGAVGGDLNLLPAWDPAGDGSFTRTGDGSVIIAVIDDAFDLSHAELAANFQPGHDFAEDDADPRPDDNALQPHGTLVTGAAAAIGNNGSQLAGSIWNVSVLPYKVSRIVQQGGVDESVFDTGAVLAAYQAAIDNGAHIVNASFGGPSFSQLEFDLIESMENAGILFVAAAGNDDANLDRSQLNFPANYDLDNVLTVAATNRQDNIASFSVYGPTSVDVAAPGLQILSTLPGGATTPFGDGNGGGVSGTSFAAPYTAGVAALIRNHVPTTDFREIRARLLESGTAVSGANPDRLTRGGRLDAAAALDRLPGPSLMLSGFRFDDGAGGNARPDPGESLELVFEIENAWQPADNIVATVSLEQGSGLTLDNDTVSLSTLPGFASRPANVTELRVPATVTAASGTHQFADIQVRLQADGGYDRTRHVRADVASLAVDTTVNESFAGRDVDLYDEFHAWHVDLTTAADALTITTTTPGGEDIDLLVRKDAPPKYLITIGIDPESGDSGFFETDAQTIVSGRADGDETVVIANPQPGTYHIVIVNFDQSSTPQPYTLRASVTPVSGGGGNTGSGGGGAMPLVSLIGLLVLAWRRRRD